MSKVGHSKYMQVQTTARLGGIDAMRHLLAIFVIVQHTWSASRFGVDMRPTYEFLTDIVDGAVWGFFFLSGYLMRPKGALWSFVRQRCKRLLFPYLLFSAAYAALGLLRGQSSFEEYLKATFQLQGTAMQLYFLPYLLIIDAAFTALFSRAIRPTRPIIGLIVAALTMLTLELPTQHSTGPNLRLIPFYVLAYATGALMARIESLWKYMFAVAALGLGIWIDQRFLDIALMLALFFAFHHFSLSFPSTLPGSGAIYLLHTPLTNFTISVLFAAVGVVGWPNFMLTVALTYFVCLGAMLVVTSAVPNLKYLLLE